MILQINPSDLLNMAGTCGVLTYFLTAVIIVGVLVSIYLYREAKRDAKLKDEEIKELNGRILSDKEEAAKNALLNLEVFNKLTDALDKILVDDRENAAAIKMLIKEIRGEVKSSKEILTLKIESIKDLIKNG